MNYLHIRLHDKYDGRIDPRGGYTVAFERSRDNSNILRFAIAKCSKRDVFNKKMGRTVAAGRLLSNRHTYATPILTDERPVEALVRATRGITNNYRQLGQ